MYIEHYDEQFEDDDDFVVVMDDDEYRRALESVDTQTKWAQIVGSYYASDAYQEAYNRAIEQEGL